MPICVFLRILMSFRTVSFSPITVVAPDEILTVRNGFQVFRVNARSISTQVVNDKSFWYFANVIFIHYAMCLQAGISTSNDAVPLAIFMTCIYPAIIHLLIIASELLRRVAERVSRFAVLLLSREHRLDYGFRF